jgi:predicted nucleic acid-binding protein
MKGVLVDTCIWSLALRRQTFEDASVSRELTALIHSEQARIIGPIRQEILSGYSNFEQYDKLRKKLTYFPNEEIKDIDFICAAEFSNLCRKKGIQGSHIDYLICAVAHRTNMKIYTHDKDFIFYEKHLPIELHLNESG